MCCFIYVRSDSSRLPGKAFHLVFDRPLIKVVIDRCKLLRIPIIALTTERSIDNSLCEYIDCLGISVFRGNANDLIKRTCQAITHYSCDYFIRVNGDSPMVDIRLLETCINYVNLMKPDICTNLLSRTFPYGVAIEIVSTRTYLNLTQLSLKSQKEHVTQHFYANAEKLNVLSVTQTNDHSKYRLTIDTKKDLTYFQELCPSNWKCSYYELLSLPIPALVFNMQRPVYESNV